VYISGRGFHDYFDCAVTVFQVVSCDLVAYYYVWVCLFIPFITQVITDKTNESCYCVSYQFTVLGRVVGGESPSVSLWSFKK
jgi:hypothetical protein